MEKDNAIIIILLILIVLSAGAYIVISGVGISFNKSEPTVNQTNITNIQKENIPSSNKPIQQIIR